MNKTLVTAALSGLLLAAGTAVSTAPMTEGKCFGINACKGKGDCGGKGHDCAGKNSCKGKGWKKMTKAQCEAKKGKFAM